LAGRWRHRHQRQGASERERGRSPGEINAHVLPPK
jgi:hypothetical protein